MKQTVLQITPIVDGVEAMKPLFVGPFDNHVTAGYFGTVVEEEAVKQHREVQCSTIHVHMIATPAEILREAFEQPQTTTTA